MTGYLLFDVLAFSFKNTKYFAKYGTDKAEAKIDIINVATAAPIDPK